MNVLEAIEKLNELNLKIKTLVRVITRIDEDSRSDKEDLDIINNIKNEIVKERDMLQDRLEKTPLVNMR